MFRKALTLLPILALASGGAAYAQTGGSAAYPTPRADGKVNIPASRAPDTGSMAFPASPGGVAATAPSARDTGSMAVPSSPGGVATSAPPAMTTGNMGVPSDHGVPAEGAQTTATPATGAAETGAATKKMRHRNRHSHTSHTNPPSNSSSDTPQ